MPSNYPDGEIWRPISGYKNYQVSNYGRVKNAKNQILKARRNGKGYLHLSLSKNGKIKTFTVHRLVAKTFIPNPHNYPEINHIDENKENNFVENLEWCTTKYNVRYSQATKIDIYNKEGEFIETLDSLGDVAEKYNVPINMVYRYSRATLPYKEHVFKLHNPEKAKELSAREQYRISRLGCDSNKAKYITLQEYTLDGIFVTTWANAKEAEKAYGISQQNIHLCKDGKIKTIGGRIFLRMEDSIEERLQEINNRKRKSKTELKHD